MRTLIRWTSLILILLAISSIACNFGAALQSDKESTVPTITPVVARDTPQPLATPIVEATEFPEQEEEISEGDLVSIEGMIPVENQEMGVRLQYPDGWFYDETFFIVISEQDSQDIFESDAMPDRLVMIVFAGPADEMDFDASSPEEMLESFTSDIDVDTEMDVIRGPDEISINGVPAQLMEMEITEDEMTAYVKMAAISNGEQAAIFMALSPKDQWSRTSDAVEDVMYSIELFEGTGMDLGIGEFSSEGIYRGDLENGAYVEDVFGEGEAHSWSFYGTASQIVFAELTPLEASMDVILQLQSADGTVLMEVDDAFEGEQELLSNYMLPEDGEYQIVVREFYDMSGAYALELELSYEFQDVLDETSAIMGSVSIDDFVEGTVDEGQDHVWVLSASAGEVVNIFVSPYDEGMDMAFSVIAPDGNYLISQYDDAFSDETEMLYGLVLEQDGDYSIVVEEYWDMPGSYSLTTEPGEEDVTSGEEGEYELIEMGMIAYGEYWESSLPQGQYVHVWDFDGVSGDVISIYLEPISEGADLQIALVDPDGEFVFDLDEGMDDEPEEIVYYELESTGVFSIAVADYWEEAVEYALSLDIN